MTSTKPYLFRTIFEWIEDNQMTPYIVVDANGQGVLVPQDYVKDGQIILNISSGSIQLYQMDNEQLHFSARFNGIAQELMVPMPFILGIYARENGQGMFFEPEDYPEEETSELTDSDAEIVSDIKPEAPVEVPSKTDKQQSPSQKPKNKGAKRDNSHLKIIK